MSAAVDANDLAWREQALARRQRPRVVATIAEGRDEQSAVDEIEAPLLASPSTARLQETTDQRSPTSVGLRLRPLRL